QADELIMQLRGGRFPPQHQPGNGQQDDEQRGERERAVVGEGGSGSRDVVIVPGAAGARKALDDPSSVHAVLIEELLEVASVNSTPRCGGQAGEGPARCQVSPTLTERAWRAGARCALVKPVQTFPGVSLECRGPQEYCRAQGHGEGCAPADEPRPEWDRE